MAARRKKQTAAEQLAPTAPPETPAAGEAAAFWVDINDLTGWKDNPRNIKPEHVADVAKSIRRFGFGPPLVAREANREIIAGHTRLLAAQKLGLKSVPVRYMNLDPAEAHILAIADNKLGERGEWNDDLLRANVGLLESAGEDLLTGTGFDADEIAKLSESAADVNDDPAGLDGDGSPKLGAQLTYSVVVQCADEREQAMLLERFDKEGLRAKPIIS